jgi:hypothetical protein
VGWVDDDGKDEPSDGGTMAGLWCCNKTEGKHAARHEETAGSIRTRRRGALLIRGFEPASEWRPSMYRGSASEIKETGCVGGVASLSQVPISRCGSFYFRQFPRCSRILGVVHRSRSDF